MNHYWDIEEVHYLASKRSLIIIIDDILMTPEGRTSTALEIEFPSIVAYQLHDESMTLYDEREMPTLYDPNHLLRILKASRYEHYVREHIYNNYEPFLEEISTYCVPGLNDIIEVISRSEPIFRRIPTPDQPRPT